MSESYEVRSKSRFRITSILLNLILIVSVMPCVPSPSTATNARMASLTSANEFTFTPQTEYFTSNNTPVSTGSKNVSIMTLDWGTVSLGNSYGHLFKDLKIGTDTIPTIPDCWFAYTYDNGSQASSWPLRNGASSYWGNYYLLFNSANVIIYEKYGEGPQLYSGSTKEWNVTLRITIFKQEAIIKLDGWVRNLNTSSNIALVAFYPIYPETDTGSTITYNFNSHLIIRTKANYAVGLLGQRTVNAIGGLAGNCWGSPTYSEVRQNTSKYLHSQIFMLLGYNSADITTLADRVGDTWNRPENVSHYNFFTAKNTADDRYDVICFASAKMQYMPSGTSETIIKNSVTVARTFSANPIHNYEMYPLLTSFDEINTYILTLHNANVTWLFNMSVKYDYPITVATVFVFEGAYLTTENLHDMVNYSNINQGYNLEFANHGWNHSDLENHSSATYAENVQSLAAAYWANVSSQPLQTYLPGYNRWGNHSREGLSDGGVQILRAADWQYDSVELGEYHGMLNIPFTSFQASNTSADVLEAQRYGFRGQCWHAVGFDTAPEKMSLETYFSAVQNTTDLLPMTLAQFADLYYGRLVYSTDANGFGVIDLSSATDAHKIYMTSTDGVAYLFVDDADGLPIDALTATVSNSRWIGANHTYSNPVMSVQVPSGIFNMTTTQWTANEKSWNANMTDPSAEVTFALSGLESGGRILYNISVDGHRIAQLRPDGAGQISFTYSGPWSEQTFEVVRYDPGAPRHNMGSLMLTIGVIVGLAAIAIVAIRSRLRKG